MNWAFNAWAKYANYALDAQVGARDRSASRGCRASSRRAPTPARLVLEGGGIETNGEGTAARHRGVAALRRAGAQSRADARRTTKRPSASSSAFGETIWLGEGCVGDDTHGHVDDIARFVARRHDRARRTRKIRPTTRTIARSVDNMRRLELAGVPAIGPLRVVQAALPARRRR